jgi:hypothetical protein
MKDLIDVAMIMAVRGAREYLRVHNLQADNEALTECVKAWIKVKLPEALSDAKAALDCNMHQVAEKTFAASMVQAGIEAAKECSTLKAQSV